MPNRLSPITGEFRSGSEEDAFRRGRLIETIRQARLTFLLSTVLNLLFLASDWRFLGLPHFYYAVGARLAVVAVSLVALVLVLRADRFAKAERTIVFWQWVTAVAVSVLVSSHSEIAMFVVLLLPLIYYLVVPVSFRWTLVSGLGCSVLMLVGYLPGAQTGTSMGLILAMLVLNCALALAALRSNRLQRLAWSSATELAEVNAELTASRQRLEQLFMAVPVPLVVSNQSDNCVMMMNDAVLKYYGAKNAGLSPFTVAHAYVNPAERLALSQSLTDIGDSGQIETTLRLADGSIRDVFVCATLTDIGGVRTILSALVDITERKQMERRLAQLATTDPLTGLPNRAQFFSAAEARICEPSNPAGRIAMLMLDIDHFKQINDTLGHDAGDVLLKAFAERLKGAVRANDLVARLGGDEFAIILTGLSDEQEVEAAVNSVLDRLRKPAVYGGRVLECRASAGASIFPLHADNLEDLVKDADIALYMAKTDGRDRMRIYNPDMRSVMEKRNQMITHARTALNTDQVVPYYQPKVDLKTGRIIGFEALLRWRHPQRGIQAPGAIAAAFDDPDLAVSLSERMLSKVVDDIRRWRDEGLAFGHVGINASAAEFRKDDLADRVLDHLRRAGVPFDCIELEVTETVFLGRGADYVERALNCLSREGVRIALDDFGTGYASLSHLKQFPVDIIKIDQSFVRDLEEDPDDAAIIRAVVNLGRSLGIGIVAEGIEKPTQAAYLSTQGCDYGQGYLFGRPQPARLMHNVLRSNANHRSSWEDSSCSSAA